MAPSVPLNCLALTFCSPGILHVKSLWALCLITVEFALSSQEPVAPRSSLDYMLVCKIKGLRKKSEDLVRLRFCRVFHHLTLLNKRERPREHRRNEMFLLKAFEL